MPYALNFDGSNDYVELDSSVDSNGANMSLRLKFKYVSGSNQCIVGDPNSTNNIIRFSSSTSVLFKFGSTSSGLTLSDALVDGETYDYYFEKNSNVVDITDVDGNSLVTTTSTNPNTFTIFGFGRISAGQYFGGELLIAELFDEASRTTKTNSWVNTTGTGSTFEDAVGGDDGTLENFATDDSQWVFYSDGGGGVVMTISEAATASDAETAQANLLSTISEAASASDTTTGKLSASLSVSESAGASDTDTGQYATSQEIIEAVQASDLTGTLLKAILTQNLSALASDTVSLKANYGLTVSETASGTDSTAGQAALIATLSESASASDTESSQAALSATISESAQGRL